MKGELGLLEWVILGLIILIDVGVALLVGIGYFTRRSR